MSGNPNWNPPLQTSSVRFPRKAVETPVIPANSTTRQRPGAPFQPVFSSQITQIPPISTALTFSGQIQDNRWYTTNINSTNEALPYNVTRQTIRGVPTPSVITIKTAERYLVFGVNFPYTMSGTDHFVFVFTNINTNEQSIKNYKPAAEYLVAGLLPGVQYYLTVAPSVNGITYPPSPVAGPFSISAIADKNSQFLNVTISGGNNLAYILFSGIFPNTPGSPQILNAAVDNNFGDAQKRIAIDFLPGSTDIGSILVTNLTNGSSYVFTVTPYVESDGGIYTYGTPTTLPPYIPGPPSDLYFTSISADIASVYLNAFFDTTVHPVPVSNQVAVYKSSFTTICSFVGQPLTTVQDLSALYAGFTVSTSLFSLSEITTMISTLSGFPGRIQADITNNNGVWYTFPISDISTGGLGYTFRNTTFLKTIQVYSPETTSYDLLFRTVVPAVDPLFTSNYVPPQSSFVFTGNFQPSNYTFIGNEFANGLRSLNSTYSTIAVGQPSPVQNIVGVSGNHVVSISFTGYDPTSVIIKPRPIFYVYRDNYNNTYTSIKPNITINGLTDGSQYIFTINAFANNTYSPSASITLTPGVQPPTNCRVAEISNYNVTVSFTPALGGADYYVVTNQLGQTVSTSPYTFVGLTANVSYFFTATSYSFNKTVYTLSSSVSASAIQEISSAYAQFIVSPTTIPYATRVRQLLGEFVPYTYTITSSGQAIPDPLPPINPAIPSTTILFPVGTSMWLSNSWPIGAATDAVASGTALVASVGGITYTVTSITSVRDGSGNLYNSFNGGPASLSTLTGQNLTMTLTPLSNSLTFRISSMTPIYDGNGNVSAYVIQNPSVPKSVVTFSGATTYNTILETNIPFFSGMAPTSFAGTLSSAPSVSTIDPAYVGPPAQVIFDASTYSSGRVDLYVTVPPFVTATSYTYYQLGGTKTGTSITSPISITGLTDGSSYIFVVSAIGNQVVGPSAQTVQFDLCTDAPRNVVAEFSNTTASITFSDSVPIANTYWMNMFNYTESTTVPIQTLSRGGAGTHLFSPNGVVGGNQYGFEVYGVLNNICSTIKKIDPFISGPPAAPKDTILQPSSNQIIFNWSSGCNLYTTETYRITEYFSNNPTGGVWADISGLTYTISAVITASGFQQFGVGQWIESDLGYAGFVLSNCVPFTSTIDTKSSSNLVYLQLDQSGVSYTFPITQTAQYNSQSNIYTNPNFPKTLGDLFNKSLTLSATYSYGTGPFNNGTYVYTLDARQNQVYGLSANTTAYMFTKAVAGVPTVTVSGRNATVSFVPTDVGTATYTVTNNFGSNVSTPPYEFQNLQTTSAYTFFVVSTNGTFTSVSSATSLPVYVGPPGIPSYVSASYLVRNVTVYATDTNLSLKTVFYDTGTQGTNCNITTASHTVVIQTGSGGYWTGGNGSIWDTSTGFQQKLDAPGTVTYSNDGNVNAMYQFVVTPSSSAGKMEVSLASYLLSITGINYVISNATTQIGSGTITSISYLVSIVSTQDSFSIQAGLSSLYYSTIPALTDTLSISLTAPTTFSNFTSYALNPSGVITVSYTFADNFGTTYLPTSSSKVFSLSGATHINTLANVPAGVGGVTIAVTPNANNLTGPSGNVIVDIFTNAPATNPTASFNNLDATIIVPRAQSIFVVESYTLNTYLDDVIVKTETKINANTANYTFGFTGLNHSNYRFGAYTTNLGISSEIKYTGILQAGSPYPLGSLTAALTGENPAAGTYTLTATLDPLLNSNATTSVYVFNGAVLTASETRAQNGLSAQQVFPFTVSGGIRYTLSAIVSQNSVTDSKASTTSIDANPFPPRAVSITISTADFGNTYRGAIRVDTQSATTNISYKYYYSSNGGATSNALGLVNTFTATYGLSYLGYAYSETRGTPTLSSSVTSSSPICNVSYGSPSNAIATYNSTNITVSWSAAPQASTYLVRSTNGELTASGIIATTVQFTGSLLSNYTFSVQARDRFRPDSDLVYSISALSPLISLRTLSVAPLNIDYNGNIITLSWLNVALNYQYTVSQTLGPAVTVDFINPVLADLSAVGILNINAIPFNTYQFAIKTSLYGISGQTTTSQIINMSTGSMTNVSQSYFGNRYTISWSAYPSTAEPAYYTVRELNKMYNEFTVTTTACSFTLPLDVSYTFQTFVTYKGISGSVTTLSAVYLYTNPIPSAPTTTFYQSNITVNWCTAVQADGAPRPAYYLVSDTCNFPFDARAQTQDGTATSITISQGVRIGSNYQFEVIAYYKGISSKLNPLGPVVSLRTAPVTNVTVDNSGRNLYVTWNPSPTLPLLTSSVIYSVSQTSGSSVLTGISTTMLTQFLSPIEESASPTTRYNFEIVANVNGISSQGTRATTCGYVYTYPPTNVGISYLGTVNGTLLTAFWSVNTTTLSGNSFAVKAVDQSGNEFEIPDTGNIKDITSYQFSSKAVSNYTYTPYVYTIRNGLSSGSYVQGTPIRVFTPAPVFVGAGFDGNYAITVSICAGSEAIGARFERPDSYTLTEINNLFFPSNSAWTITQLAPLGESTVFQIPTLGARGLTYNFEVQATLCGLVSALNSVRGSLSLSITTKPVDPTTLFANYTGTVITVSWGEALQPSLDNTRPTKPNGGYTLYVSSLPFPLTTLYKDTSFRWGGGVPGGTYQFSVEALNNNVGSALVTSTTAIVTLYKPTVQFLTVTNSGGGLLQPTRVKMILDWFPDPNVTGETYTAVLYSSTGLTLSTAFVAADQYTTTFDGSLNLKYFFGVVANYKGISGDQSTTEITNTVPVMTTATILNIGNLVTINYGANEVTFFDVCMRPTNGGTANFFTSNNSSSSYTVSSRTGIGYTYSVSVTAFYNGLPSATQNLSTTIIEPNVPTNLRLNYNNTTVSVTWSAATNASSYTIAAYDLSTSSLVTTQPGITNTFTSFTGIAGRSFNVSLYASSASQVVSAVTASSVSIVIPPPPTDLVLSNTGQTVIVTWSANSTVYSSYSFYVTNVLQRGVIIYSAQFALPGDTFQGSVGQTYGVSLYGTSLCNVTSVSATSNTWTVYQPFTPFVTATNTGADIFLQWPQDPVETCVFLVTNNYSYSNLLFPDPTGYTTSKNGWITTRSANPPYTYTYTHDPRYDTLNITLSENYRVEGGYVKYTVANNAYSTAGTSYIYSVKPYFNQVAGPVVTTDTTDTIILYQPTTVGNFTPTTNGNTLTLNWQYAVVFTNPAQLVQSYAIVVTPSTGTAKNYSVVGNTYSITDFSEESGLLSVSIAAVSPSTEYTGSKIYGTPKTLTTVIPGLNTVSIARSLPLTPERLDVTIPAAVGNYIWFLTSTTTGTTSPVCNVFLNKGSTTSQTYPIDVSLGYYYTISAYGYPSDIGFNIPGAVSSIPPNPLPYAATTFAVVASTLSVSHQGLAVTVKWGGVSAAVLYTVVEYDQDTVQRNAKNTTNTSITFTETHSVGSTYTYQITAFNQAGARFGNTTVLGISLPSSIHFPSPTINETLTVPTQVLSLAVTQSRSTAIVTWLPPANIPTPTIVNTQYSVCMALANGTFVSNIGGITSLSCQFAITSGSSYTFAVTPNYYGISGSPIATTDLGSISPRITGLTLTDNGNKTATLAGTANTPGNWYLTSQQLTGTPIATSSTSFSSNTSIQLAGASISFGITFLAPTGLTDVSTSPTVTFPNPVFATPTTTNNGSITDRSFKLNLSGTGTLGAVSWTIATPTNTEYQLGSFSVSHTSITYKFTTAVWSPLLVATFPVGSIVLSNDGFSSTNTTAVTFTPASLAITAVLYNNAGTLTLSASVPPSTVPQWTYPTVNGVPGGISDISTLTVTYGSVTAGTIYTISAGTLCNSFQGYSNSNAAAISSVPVSFTISSVTFADNRDGTSATLTATYGAGFTGGTGTPAWTFPSATSNGGGYYSLSRGTVTTGNPTTTAIYTVTQKGSNYAIAANQISLAYSGITSNYGTLLTASSANPTITNVSSAFFGCIEDTPTTNTITINVSGNISGSLNVPLPTGSGLTAPTYTGQGTTNMSAGFTGGSKYYNSTTPYSFANMITPGTNVTPGGFSLNSGIFSLSFNFVIDSQSTAPGRYYNILRVCPADLSPGNEGTPPYRMPAMWIVPQTTNLLVQYANENTIFSLSAGSNYSVNFVRNSGGASVTVSGTTRTFTNTAPTMNISYYLWMSDPLTALYGCAADLMTMSNTTLIVNNVTLPLSNYTGNLGLKPNTLVSSSFSTHDGGLSMQFTLTLNYPNNTNQYLNILRVAPINHTTDGVGACLPFFGVSARSYPDGTGRWIHWRYNGASGNFGPIVLKQPYCIAMTVIPSSGTAFVNVHERDFSGPQLFIQSGATSVIPNITAGLWMSDKFYTSASNNVTVTGLYYQSGYAGTTTVVVPNNVTPFSNDFQVKTGTNVTPSTFSMTTGNYQMIFDATFTGPPPVNRWRNILRVSRTLCSADRFPSVFGQFSSTGANYIQVAHNAGGISSIGPFPIGQPVRTCIVQRDGSLAVNLSMRDGNVFSSYSTPAANVTHSSLNLFMSSINYASAVPDAIESSAKNVIIQNFSYIVDGVTISTANGNANGGLGQYVFGGISISGGGFTSTTSSASVTLAIPTDLPRISSLGSFNTTGNVVNGFNVIISASYTPSVYKSIVISCSTTDGNWSSITPSIFESSLLSSNLVQNTGDRKSTNPNTSYTFSVAARLNGIVGSPTKYTIVVPGAVTGTNYGSTPTSTDKTLATRTSVYLTWTATTLDNQSTSDLYTYFVYSGDPPATPSVSAPAGSPISGPLSQSTTSYLVTGLTAGTKKYYIITVYTDPFSGHKFYSEGSSLISFNLTLDSFVVDEWSALSSSYTFVNNGFFSYELYGGGGAGGYGRGGTYAGGGGGGGGFTDGNSFPYTANTRLTYVVGSQGLGNVTSDTAGGPASRGGASTITYGTCVITAGGGDYGGIALQNTTIQNGAGGGGGLSSVTNPPAGSQSTFTNGNPGSSGNVAGLVGGAGANSRKSGTGGGDSKNGNGGGNWPGRDPVGDGNTSPGAGGQGGFSGNGALIIGGNGNTGAVRIYITYLTHTA